MTKFPSKFVKHLPLAGLSILAALTACLMLWVIPGSRAGQKGGGPRSIGALSPYIDTHTHFDEKNPEGTVQAVLKAERVQRAAKIYLQIPPYSFDDPTKYDAEVILPAAKKYADKIGVLGGGGSLNPMIMEAVSTGKAGADVQKKFRERAEELIREGVSGFGEMAAEHFVGATPYEYAPPDHPLYLLLADIAAQHGVPIDIHMEAVPQAMALPPELKSPPNAAQLHENQAAFERLLSHNPRAKIIWAHLGTDNTGFRTPEGSRRLLQAHPNLYMEIKFDPKLPGKNPVWVDGIVKAEWLKVFQEFPDRFIFGSDQHYPEQGQPMRWQADVAILNRLPADLRTKFGIENAAHVFGAASGGGPAAPEKK
jgi:predicted TIM-barrel fold metal-dependent hydrolase